MYTPKAFENNNIEQLHQFIERFNFATLVSHHDGELQVTHVPVMLNRKQGKYGALAWHMAKLNPHAKVLEDVKNTLCVFRGPHAYISPSWHEKTPDVPTWNYAAVHVHGVPVLISKEQLSSDLSIMVRHHEGLLNNPDYIVPDEYKNKLMNYAVGFHMEISRIEGKFKFSQNRSLKHQEEMLQGLRKQNTPEALALADFVQSIE